MRPARTLPTVTPPLISLDALLARAGAIPQPHTIAPVRRAAQPTPERASPHSIDTPRSILLTVTVTHCACGATARAPAPYVLVRYAENAHTVHYRATGTDAVRPELFATLPHERRETHVNVPYCEECF